MSRNTRDEKLVIAFGLFVIACSIGFILSIVSSLHPHAQLLLP